MDAVDRFRALLRIPTVSRTDVALEDREAFARFRTTLAELYPRLHERLDVELVAGDSLLFRWPGRGGGAPSVLMAHHDVVPADEPGWRHEPFDAVVDGERIWGRGTLDDKGALVALLEAVESRVAAGFEPAADVYLFSGANEETTGAGAAAAVDLLTARGVSPGLVLDEGGAVAADAFPGVSGEVAFVGVAEKGMAGIRLVAEKPGGHAATPARNGATTTLARAILRLEQHPAPAHLSAPVAAMLRALAPRTTGLQRRLFRNPDRYRRALTRILAARGGEGEAIVRTTRAVTRLSGSAADNVIAERATATVNARIAVGSSVARTVDEVRRAVGDEVGVELTAGGDPSPVSPATGPEWDRLTRAIGATFPDAVIAPYVMLQASDARHFARISGTVYRFMPFDLTAAELGTLHAIDESIRVSTWLRGIGFFDRLLGEL
ncbi:MAG: M20/M25/M40 family metallo-hydrolase [Pseudolysinimonas sp.]